MKEEGVKNVQKNCLYGLWMPPKDDYSKVHVYQKFSQIYKLDFHWLNK